MQIVIGSIGVLEKNDARFWIVAITLNTNFHGHNYRAGSLVLG